MKKRPAITSRDLGLEFAAICGKHFLGLEHLHYGYWSEGLPVSINNLRTAQENYTNFLFSQIPAGVRTILDVGCGSGHTSKRLADMGYKVACVSPSPVLSAKVRELMGDTCKIYECKFEDLQTEDKYDLVLFSESFQYMKVQRALDKTLEIINPGGHLLVCDVFRKDVELEPGKKGVGGGHLPNMDLMDDTMKNVVRPIVDSSLNFLGGRYPLMSRAIQWLYRKRIRNVYQKYFDSNRASADFVKSKSYRLLLYRYTCKVPAGNPVVSNTHPNSKATRQVTLPAGI
jgi:SAM-dependent methyltransferase